MDIDSAVILAAGEGTQLRPLTRNRPKPMLSAGTVPILAHVLDALIDAGLDDIHVVVGYNRSRVQNYFGSRYRGRELTYHVQAKRLGTGHATLQAEDGLAEEFVVVNGDELIDRSVVADVIDTHTPSVAATVAVLESERAPEFGAVRMRGNAVTEIIEEPSTDEYRLLNRGVYAFDPKIFTAIEAVGHEGSIQLPDAIARVVDAGELVRGVRSEEEWVAATFPWDLLELTRYVLARGDLPQPRHREGVYVHESAAVHPDATLVAPVVVDADATVGPQATVGPDTAVGRNASVESGAVVTDSLVESDVSVGANATVVESVLAQGARLGAGVTIPGGPSDVVVGDAVHRERRLGAVVADRTEIGGGSTIGPGTLVGPDARVTPGGVVRDNIPARTEVRD